jgi:hypothetical protein
LLSGHLKTTLPPHAKAHYLSSKILKHHDDPPPQSLGRVRKFGVADGGEVLGFWSREDKFEISSGSVIFRWLEMTIENHRGERPRERDRERDREGGNRKPERERRSS